MIPNFLFVIAQTSWEEQLRIQKQEASQSKKRCQELDEQNKVLHEQIQAVSMRHILFTREKKWAVSEWLGQVNIWSPVPLEMWKNGKFTVCFLSVATYTVERWEENTALCLSFLLIAKILSIHIKTGLIWCKMHKCSKDCIVINAWVVI